MKKIQIIMIVIMLFAIILPGIAQDSKEEKITNPQVLEGIKLFQMGKNAEALAVLEKEAKANPNDPDVFNAIAIIHSKSKDFEKALSNFDKAIALKAGNFKTMYNKLNLLVSMGRVEEAKNMLKGMTERYPDHATGWVNYGAILMQTGQKDEALACYEKAISIDKKDFDAYFKKGQVLMLMKKYPESRAAFEASLKINPRYSSAKQGLLIVKDILDKKSKGYIRIAQILVKDKALADKLKADLDGGKDFARLAVKNSVDASAKSGGHLGFVKKGDLVKLLEDAIFVLKVDQVSPVIRSPLGYHIFLRIE